VNFEEIEWRKVKLLDEAAGNFLDRGPVAAPLRKLAAQWAQYQKFLPDEAAWLADYALYAELRRQFNTGAWTAWPEPLRRREPRRWPRPPPLMRRRVAEEQVLQFAFSLQWNNLREAAAEHGIRIMGDVAIFVNMDSADVWVHPEFFELDEELQPIRIAGVPPDYFSPTGQRWGNPLYRWDVLAEQGFGLVDRPHPPRLPSSMTSSASTTSAASRLTGRFPPRKRRPSKASGSRRRAWSSSARWRRALGPLPLVAEDLG
jgi:4-alpha-glucanotransferase